MARHFESTDILTVDQANQTFVDNDKNLKYLITTHLVTLLLR